MSACTICRRAPPKYVRTNPNERLVQRQQFQNQSLVSRRHRAARSVDVNAAQQCSSTASPAPTASGDSSAPTSRLDCVEPPSGRIRRCGLQWSGLASGRGSRPNSESSRRGLVEVGAESTSRDRHRLIIITVIVIRPHPADFERDRRSDPTQSELSVCLSAASDPAAALISTRNQLSRLRDQSGKRASDTDKSAGSSSLSSQVPRCAAK